MPRDNSAISANCSVDDVGPISPGNVTNINSTIVSLPFESYSTGVRNVFAEIHVSWGPPETLASAVTTYEIRVQREPVPLNDMGNVLNVERVGPDDSAIEQTFSFEDVPAGTLTVFVQVSSCEISGFSHESINAIASFH